MYRAIYRPTLDRYVGRHIYRHSADISTEICRSTYRPIYRPRYRPRVGWHIVRLSADIAVDTRPIRWPLTVGGISVDCRWYIGRFSYNVSQNLRLPVMPISCFFVTEAFHETIKIKKLKKPGFTPKQLFYTAITVVVCGLHWRSPYNFSGMDLALSYSLLNHSTKATLVFRMYFNLYLLAGYIQEDVRIHCMKWPV